MYLISEIMFLLGKHLVLQIFTTKSICGFVNITYARNKFWQTLPMLGIGFVLHNVCQE